MTIAANFTQKSAILSFVITHELLTTRLFLDSLANKYFRMKAKKNALLFLAALASISVQAQEIKEITVEKPGKFMKQVKKELASITKLKVTGAMTCEDYTVLTQMPNLQYLDLREAKFDPNKALSSSCSDYLCLHGTLANLEEIHMPTTGFKGIRELVAPRLHKIYIPFGFEIEDVISHNILRENVSTHSVYVENIPESFGPDLLKKAISKLSEFCMYLYYHLPTK